MKNHAKKKTYRREKIFTTVIAYLSCLSLFSVGFSSFLIVNTNDYTATNNINIAVAPVEERSLILKDESEEDIYFTLGKEMFIVDGSFKDNASLIYNLKLNVSSLLSSGFDSTNNTFTIITNLTSTLLDETSITKPSTLRYKIETNNSPFESTCVTSYPHNSLDASFVFTNIDTSLSYQKFSLEYVFTIYDIDAYKAYVQALTNSINFNLSVSYSIGEVSA